MIGEDLIGRVVKGFRFRKMEISGGRRNRIVLDCRVVRKRIGYDMGVGVMLF